MVRVTNSVATHRRKKRMLKLAKGFFGDRKNHLRMTSDAVMSALSFNYQHRKQRKGLFRRLWITRIGIAAKMHGLSYHRLMYGLKGAGSLLNRKMLAQLAVEDPQGFAAVAERAKAHLANGA